MYIGSMHIDSQHDLDKYKTEVSGKLILVIPLLENSRDHFIKNNIIAFYVLCDNKEYIFPYKHPESVFSEYSVEDVVSNTKCYFYNKLILDYHNVLTNNIYDLELVHYLNTTEPIETEGIDTEYFYHRLYSKYGKSNTLVSLANFVKYSRAVLGQANLTSEQGLQYYSDMQSTWHLIERNGLQVNDNFVPIFGTPINLVNNKVYTKYNYYTATGRPSNRYGGINFAALPKQDDTRECFVSRYTDGKLVELDFKAYHPHIIAYLCDYNFGDENVYEHLAKHYFDTATPTEEQITNAKEYTFNQIYGGINKKYLHIEFFAKTKAYTDLLWEQYKEKGYIVSSISGRTLHSDYETSSNTQLFNYYIQMTETELNGAFLKKLFNDIDFNETLPILYTYDAVVFDCKKAYINKLIDKIFANTTDKFPISVKVGDNYKEMKNYNYEATTIVHVHE